MKPKNLDRYAGFTLLELVVVLAILAIVTTLATREIGHVQDQQRFETSRIGLENIEAAILGVPVDRLPDADTPPAGFVADMGRLPRTVPTADGAHLTLAELWLKPDPIAGYDVRSAVESNGVSAAEADAQVWVAGGWRGPYVRLPLGADMLYDGWGNPYVSPADASPPDPDEAGYARLRNALDAPIVNAGVEIALIRQLGANSRRDLADTGYDRDLDIAFTNRTIRAGLKGQVEVLNGNAPAVADPADRVIVRAFGPDPLDATKIKVWSTTNLFLANPVVWEIPVEAGMTIGPRAVRAYFRDLNLSGNTANVKSAVRHVTLRSGVNPLNLTLDR